MVETQTTETSLYFHPVAWTSIAINTQPLPGNHVFGSGFGAASQTLTCASPYAGNTLGAENEYHTYRGYSMPAMLDYSANVGQAPRIEAVRGVATDIQLDAEGGATLHWFMITTSSPTTAVANFKIQAVVRGGDAINIDNKAFDEGELIMSGALGPVTLAGGNAYGPTGQPAAGITSTSSSAGTVYAFAIPMKYEKALFEQSRGFNVRVDTFIDNPACNDPATEGSMMTSTMGPFASGTHQPRLVVHNTPALSIAQPLVLESVPDVGILVRMGVFSPWGGYDVDVKSATVELIGLDNEVNIRATASAPLGPHPSAFIEAVYSGWLWDFEGVTPPDGMYAMKVKVPNLQGTAFAVSTSEFRLLNGHIVTGPERDAPAPGMPLLLLALLALGIVVRRRTL